MDKMRVEGAKDNAFLTEMKQKVNEAVEIFIEASKKAEDKMSFKAFTLGNMDIEAQYRLSDIIFTQTALHLKEYTHDDIEKYSYATSVSTEKDDADAEHLVLWYHFSREKPAPAEKVELTHEDINPYKKMELLPAVDEEASVEAVADEEEKHARACVTYDA
jgi:hypothetical protein